MADKIAEKAQAVIADPAAAAAGDGMKKIMEIKIFGMNVFVLFALLIVLGVVGYFVYKYFFAKKPTVPVKEPEKMGGKPAQGKGEPEIDQIHAYYQQQLALQEQEYRKRLEHMRQDEQHKGKGEEEEEEEEEDREVEIEDEPESHDVPGESEESHESQKDQESDDPQPFRVEINNPPPPQQEVKVVRRGKKKGQELNPDEYARRAARLMMK